MGEARRSFDINLQKLNFYAVALWKLAGLRSGTVGALLAHAGAGGDGLQDITSPRVFWGNVCVYMEGTFRVNG